jgi:iron complex outermembrane recepter protein
MHTGNKPFVAATLAAAVSSLIASMALAADQAPDDQLEQVIVTGTRVADRSATDTAVAVDVISATTLEKSGVTEVNQALAAALPSFNFPRPSLNDGTDTIRPATLRGLAPDQTLVLVNSKRRHTSSLVNVNGSIGRGAAAVDLNTIPTVAIRSVEVLRDGASAQYGSDAIAGVINVLLKTKRDGGGVSATYGWHDSTYSVPTSPLPAGATWSAPDTISRSVSDGKTTTIGAWKGFGFGDTGFLTLSGEYKYQQHSERDGFDVRQQYALVAGAFDPREATINRFNAWYGDPQVKQLTAFANFGADLDNGKLYGWASWQSRDARSAGFFRRASDARNVTAIYPDGFLPIIAPLVTDYSAALGRTFTAGAWDFDTSAVYGYNRMAYTIENTLNASLGASSKKVFDAGGFHYGQTVFNFSGVRKIDAGFSSPLNLAAGVEARREFYGIFAGEPDSYRNGDPTKASGSQVFPGFQPSDSLGKARSAVGAYVDLEANVTSQFLASVAARGEHYSDFGSNLSGKLALRYDFAPSFALRGSVQNGFRAPSLQQQYFAATSTNFIGGVPFDIKTFPVSDPRAAALGAKPLNAEKSLNYTLGLVWKLGGASVTVDAYQINMTDRIVLSENLTQSQIQAYLNGLGYVGVSGGRFFINGVDTRTRGVDIVANLPALAVGSGKLAFSLAGAFNNTSVTKVPPLSTTLAQLFPVGSVPPLFGRVNVLTYEQGQPKNKFTASANWSQGKLGANLRAVRYGTVLVPGTTAATDFTLGAKVLLDLEAHYQLSERFGLAIGADNLTDQYPDAFTAGRNGTANLNSTGNTPFSGFSPFGFTGRYVYARLSVNL